MGTTTINVAIDIEGDDDATNKAAELVNGMPEIFQAIIAERHAQDQQWGGLEHDDGHRPHVWENLIISHASRLTERIMDEFGHSAPDYRQRLVKIAALAVAAVQSWDRIVRSEEYSDAGGVPVNEEA